MDKLQWGILLLFLVTLNAYAVQEVRTTQSASSVKTFTHPGIDAVGVKDTNEPFWPKGDRSQSLFIRECLSQDQLLTLLYDAVLKNDGKKVNDLIDRGVPFNRFNHTRNSPVESAAGLGNNGALEALLKRGANPNVNYGRAIILAALYQKGETLRLLSKYGGDMKIKDKDDECTALHYIAADGDVKTAQFLISKGADPYAICRGKETPLVWATSKKNQAMIDFLNSLQN